MEPSQAAYDRWLMVMVMVMVMVFWAHSLGCKKSKNGYVWFGTSGVLYCHIKPGQSGWIGWNGCKSVNLRIITKLPFSVTEISICTWSRLRQGFSISFLSGGCSRDSKIGFLICFLGGGCSRFITLPWEPQTGPTCQNKRWNDSVYVYLCIIYTVHTP